MEVLEFLDKVLLVAITMVLEAAGLIARLHGRVLRAAADACGTHFQGLQHVARYIRAHRADGRGPRQAAVVRKLTQLDDAVSLTRHITVASSENFMVEVMAQCTKVTKRQNITVPRWHP